VRIIEPDEKFRDDLSEMNMDIKFINTFIRSDFLVLDENNNEITGVAGVGGIFHIGGIFVKQEYRGKNIASKLNKLRDDELKKRGYSFFIGTTYTTNPNANEISKILQDRSARPVFSFSMYNGFTTTLFIQEFNTKGKFVGKFLNFFNTKFGTLCLALALKLVKKFWNNLFLTESSNYEKIDLRYCLKNFHKIKNYY
jgi:hypothetical protein